MSLAQPLPIMHLKSKAFSYKAAWKSWQTFMFDSGRGAAALGPEVDCWSRFPEADRPIMGSLAASAPLPKLRLPILLPREAILSAADKPSALATADFSEESPSRVLRANLDFPPRNLDACKNSRMCHPLVGDPRQYLCSRSTASSMDTTYSAIALFAV